MKFAVGQPAQQVVTAINEKRPIESKCARLQSAVVQFPNQSYMFRRHIAPLLIALAIAAGPRSSGAQTAVIVHRTSAFNNFSAENLRRVFLGKTTVAENGQPLVLVELTSIRGRFTKSLLGLSADEFHRRWVGMVFRGDALGFPLELTDAAAVKKFVAEHPGAVGYIPASEMDDTVKTLRVDGKLPSDAGYLLK